jgi:hypothetical protein
MSDKSQELAISLLEEAREKGTLDPSVEARLSRLMSADVRPQVAQTLETAHKSARMAELVRKLELEAQYGARLDTLKHYGFLNESGEAKKGDIQKPSFEKAMSTFKPEELEVASHFQEPTLLLVPETSFDAKVKALDAHKQGVQEIDTYVDEIYSKTDSGSDKITGWRAVIVDGAQEMKTYEGDDLDLRFDKRIAARKATRKKGERGMDRHRYVLLMMEAVKNGDPVDKEFYTLLDDDSALSDSYVPSASFRPGDRGVVFSGFRPVIVYGRARFRASVGGDVLLS